VRDYLPSRAGRSAIDIVLLSAAFWLSLALRFDGDIPSVYLELGGVSWFYVVSLQYGGLLLLRVPNFAWKYVGLREVVRVFAALFAAASVLLALRLFLLDWLLPPATARLLKLPIGAILIDFVLAFLAVSGVRALFRMSSERARARRFAQSNDSIATLLIGAGEAGLGVAKEVKKRPDLGIRIVGFVDDNPEKIGRDVHGFNVLGSTETLEAIARRTGAQEAIITLGNPTGDDVRRIRRLCGEGGLKVRIIPSWAEILDGRARLTVRDVSIDDLLRRPEVELGGERLALFLKGRSVLVTGAGGSIGSEICRQLARLSPRRLILLERSEPQLFAIHSELTRDASDLELVASLTDLCDKDDVDSVLERYAPDVVFHAAAYKHVPLLEWNCRRAIKNNILATYRLVEAAERHQVETFVMLSTDKAVNPTSIMGATKRVTEMIVQAKDHRSLTKFVSVRFGNVLGSTGSVIPIFTEQIESGGPVTVTHPEMRRYFMTISEAAQLVLLAGSMGLGGEIFLLDMGEPVRIVDLAEDLIRLSGFIPGKDVAIEFTGVRPGEKLFEELGFDPKRMVKTLHAKIFVLTQDPPDWDTTTHYVTTLDQAVAQGKDDTTLRRHLERAVPEMRRDARPDVVSSVPNASHHGVG